MRLQFGDSNDLPVTVSGAVARYPEDGDSVTELLASAASRSRRRRRAAATRSADRRARPTPSRESETFDVFQGLILAVDAKDRYTKRHSEDVARYAMFLARLAASPPTSSATIRVAGLLHDVGKIGIPDQILRKPGKLTDDEFEVVKQHVALGDMIVRDLPDIDTIRAGIRHHHERWDGRGYLDGLAGDEIPLVARILAVARRVLRDDDDPPVPQGARRARRRCGGWRTRRAPSSTSGSSRRSSTASSRTPTRRSPATTAGPRLWLPTRASREGGTARAAAASASPHGPSSARRSARRRSRPAAAASTPCSGCPSTSRPCPCPTPGRSCTTGKLHVDRPGRAGERHRRGRRQAGGQAVKGPDHGNLSLNHDGTVDYVPDHGFTGVDTFTYLAHDGTIGVAAARDPDGHERRAARGRRPLRHQAGRQAAGRPPRRAQERRRRRRRHPADEAGRGSCARQARPPPEGEFTYKPDPGVLGDGRLHVSRH